MYILIPKNDNTELVNIYTGKLALGDNEEDRDWNTRRYIYEVLLVDPNLGEAGYELYSMVADIRKSVDECYDGNMGYIDLPKAHIAKLQKVVDKPQAKRNPAGMAQMLHFMEAIKNPVADLPSHLYPPDKIAAKNEAVRLADSLKKNGSMAEVTHDQLPLDVPSVEA